MHPFPQAQSNQAVTGVADTTTATAESRAVVAPARSRPRDQAPRSQGPGGTAAAATVTLGGLRAPAMRADLKAHGPGPGGEEVQAHLVPRGRVSPSRLVDARCARGSGGLVVRSAAPRQVSAGATAMEKLFQA